MTLFKQPQFLESKEYKTFEGAFNTQSYLPVKFNGEQIAIYSAPVAFCLIHEDSPWQDREKLLRAFAEGHRQGKERTLQTVRLKENDQSSIDRLNQLLKKNEEALWYPQVQSEEALRNFGYKSGRFTAIKELLEDNGLEEYLREIENQDLKGLTKKQVALYCVFVEKKIETKEEAFEILARSGHSPSQVDKFISLCKELKTLSGRYKSGFSKRTYGSIIADYDKVIPLLTGEKLKQAEEERKEIFILRLKSRK